MGSRRGLCSLLLIVLIASFLASCLSGTGSGATNDPPPQGTAEKPLVTEAVARLTESSPQGGMLRGEKPLTPGSQAVVGMDRLYVHLQLDPVPDAAWFKKNVTVTGVDGLTFDADLLARGIVGIPVPEGESGDQIKIALTSVVAQGLRGNTAQYSLRRRPEPTVKMLIFADGSWRELAPSQATSLRPLRLRIVATKNMDRTTVEAGIHEALAAPVSVKWVSATTAEFELADPPGALRIPTRDMRDTEGLWVRGGLPTLFTSGVAQLHRLAPGEAAATDLATVPAHGLSAHVSSNGEHLLMNYISETTGGLGTGLETGPVIVDTAGGVRTDCAAQGKPLGWTADGDAVILTGATWAIVDAEGHVLQQANLPGGELRFHTLSPDGTRLAALRFRFAQDGYDDRFLVPTDLAVIDLVSGQTTWVEDVAKTYLPPQEWVVRAAPAWSPDGTEIAVLSDKRPDGEIRVVSLATGSARTASPVTGRYPTTLCLSWSPDGQWWLYNDTLIATDLSTPARQLDGAVAFGRHLWSPDAQWVAYSRDWQQVALVPVGGGAAIPLGMEEAMGSGWDGDGRFYFITWPDARLRYSEYWWQDE